MASVPGAGIERKDTVLGKMEWMIAKRFEHENGGTRDGGSDNVAVGEAKKFVPYLLHRLDMATSGVMLFGKYGSDREKLEGIFRDDRTAKTYLALVRGVPRGNKITFKLKARESDVLIDAKTRFKVQETFKTLAGVVSLVEIQIDTGRKHQIRQHFASIGCPVVLDSQYGDSALNRRFRIRYRLGRQFLHAMKLHFFHPTLEREIEIDAPLTADLELVMKRLRGK